MNIPIGDGLADATARLVLIWFNNEFLLIQSTEGINITLYKRFVDDSNIFTAPVPADSKRCFIEQHLIAYNTSSNHENVPPDERTAFVFKDIAKSITQMLSWTKDVPSINPNGKTLVLDLACLVTETNEGTLLNYEFI